MEKKELQRKMWLVFVEKKGAEGVDAREKCGRDARAAFYREN
jgi:hypothetical protein